MRLSSVLPGLIATATAAFLFSGCSVPEKQTVITIQSKPAQSPVVGYWVVDADATATATGNLTSDRGEQVALTVIDGVVVTAKTNITDPASTREQREAVLNATRVPSVQRSLLFHPDGTGEDWFVDPKYFRQLKRSFNWHLDAASLRLEYVNPPVVINAHLEQTNRIRCSAPRGPILFRREK